MGTWQWCGTALVLATVYCSITEAQIDNTSSPIMLEVGNFQEVTTVDESNQNMAAFSFSVLNSDSVNHSFDLFTNDSLDCDIIELQWETVNSRSRGLITVTAESDGLRQGHNTSEGAMRYRFTVNITDLGEGPLQLTISIKLRCMQNIEYSCNPDLYRYQRGCTCDQWQYQGESETILVSAKRGDIDVVKLRDVTTNSDFMINKLAVFEVELGPLTGFSRYLSYDAYLNWSQVNGNQSGTIRAKQTSACSFGYRQFYDGDVEKVAQNGTTYRISVPINGLGDGRLLVNLTINLYCITYIDVDIGGSRRSRCECKCAKWQVKWVSNSLEISAKKGHFHVVNFRDSTTSRDLENKAVTFEFEFDSLFPFPSLNTSLFFDRHLNWSQASGINSGEIRTAQLERVGQTGTYRLSVPLHLLGEGRLLVNLNIGISRIRCRYYPRYVYTQYSRNVHSRYVRTGSFYACLDWLIRVTSDTLEISAKRGHFDVVNFRDTTTSMDLDNKTVTFEFELDPLFPLSSLNTSVRSPAPDLHLAWSQVSGIRIRFGVIRSAQLERVGQTGTYRLSVPLYFLGEGHLLVNLTIGIFCSGYGYSGCYDWLITATSDPLKISAKRGPVSIVNLRDITTQKDLEGKHAVLAFDIHPKFSPSVALGYSVQIQWSELRKEFGGYLYVARTYYLPPAGRRSCRGTPNNTLELVGAASYKLTVAVAVLGSGPLSINVSVNLVCLRVTSHYCPLCSEWHYTSQSSSMIDISSKRGSLGPFEVDMQLWPKEQCFEAADAIKASDVSSILMKLIRDNAANISHSSHLNLYGERYLCERKGYLSFRGVLVKRLDFLATKMRDILADWLKGGARHIVVADRQMNVKEGACGIALASLEDPPCSAGLGLSVTLGSILTCLGIVSLITL